jgi:RimJ/RimL family protein N-acetyltransferase
MTLCDGEGLRPYLEAGVCHPLPKESYFVGQFDGAVTAVAGFSDWNKVDVELSLWSAGLLSRAFLRRLWAYCFEELGCARVTARTSAKNDRCIKVLERVGFTLEGRLRKAFDGDTDLLIFGLTREDFRYG